MRRLGAWRWQALGWWKGAQIPFLLAVFLGELLFITPLRAVSWRLTLGILPTMLILSGGLVALLVCTLRQARTETRGFLKVLPFPPATSARVELASDLAASLAWASVWPLLVPARPHVSGLWILAHLWGCASGILAARLARRRAALLVAALAGAMGPGLAVLYGMGRAREDWEHALWPWGAMALALLTATAWVPAALASAPEPSDSRGEQGPAWVGFRFPLPWRAGGLETFLARGNLPLLVGFGFSAAFASFILAGSRALEGFSPRLVSVLVGMAMSVPLAVGFSEPVREFLLTRPLSRRRCLAAAAILGGGAALLAPAAGLLSLHRTPDAEIEARIERAVTTRVLDAGFSASREGKDLPPEHFRGIAEETLRNETGLEDLDFQRPRLTREEFLAAARLWRERGWLATGILALLWLAAGFWVRMRHGSRGRLAEAALLAALAAVTLPEFVELGWRLPWPALPLPLLGGLLLLAVAGIVRSLLAMELR